MKRNYKVLWRKGNTTRYILDRKDGFVDEIQLGKYRGADAQDKALKIRAKWHNKYYVDVFGKTPKLFNTKTQQKEYFLNYIKRTGK